ncbi:Glutathione reductase [Oligella urethralis]|uniref:glutathione-disulfide reductase n=1 Tax=Oligella urethralis TaxID=90245 RepID=UPI000E05E1D4|nr:glutathione-disulfide reductase [Oligella urethralis]SUA66044.1 Glutathione reductase [Oligella urethralis]
MEYQYDLFVIGAGSGGVRAARFAAQAGAKVAIAESKDLGGTCVNVGCIPKKLYSYAAQFNEAFSEAAGYGWSVGETSLDWEVLKRQRAQEITRLNGIYDNLIKNSGAELIRGWAKLLDEHTVEVEGQQYSAKYILVVPGGWPMVPDIPGKEHVITSNEVFDLPVFPKRFLIVGGGYIACEFSSIFNALGSQVTQLYRGEQVLRGFDGDIRQHISEEMRKAGVDLRVQSDVASIEKKADHYLVHLKNNDTLEVDAVMYATGRVPRTADLGLERVGVTLGQRGEILVDENYRSNIPSIFALGDVTDRVQLTPVATGEAMVLVDYLFGKGERKLSYDNIPTAVFTHPNIGTVGLTEEEAREQFDEVVIYRTDFRPLKHTLSGSSARTMMKLVVDKASDRVVGLHMVGDDAGEITQGFAVAIKAGATKAVFDSTIGIHPTAAEEFVTMRQPVTE